MTEAEHFRRLFDDHYGPVVAFAVRRTPDPADGADIAAETFAIAWRRIAVVPAGHERAWLFAVARKVLANWRRGTRRRGALAERLCDDLRDEARRLAAPATGSMAAIVGEAMTTLRSADREVLQLVAWDGLTPAEAAVVLSISAEAARTRLHRARTRLRQILVAQGVTPGTTADMSGADTTAPTRTAQRTGGDR